VAAEEKEEEELVTTLSASLTFAADPLEVARARRSVADQLARWGVAADRTVLVVVSELMTDAIARSPGGVELTVTLTGDRVRVRVVDVDAAAGAPGSAAGGFGLNLVDRLVDDWDMTQNGSAEVWADTEVTAHTTPPASHARGGSEG
jgi:anti-sigma regulatory factor (Ser/Thr protein kinase)